MSSAQLLFVVFASVGLTALVLAGSIAILRRVLPSVEKETDGSPPSVALRPQRNARGTP